MQLTSSLILPYLFYTLSCHFSAPVAPAGLHVAPSLCSSYAWVKGRAGASTGIRRDVFPPVNRRRGNQLARNVLKMKGFIDNLERLGHPVTLGLAVSLILIGLRKEFDGFVQNYNMHSLGKTVNELHAMLVAPEQKTSLILPKKRRLWLYKLFELFKSRQVKKHNKPQTLKCLLCAVDKIKGMGKHKHALCSQAQDSPPLQEGGFHAKDSICMSVVDRTLEGKLSSVLSRVAKEEKERSL
ncbi:hypothetical protein Tco_1467879 [Tanacetum coccineum]